MSANPFVWYELVTSDIDAALAFYGRLLGWEAQDFPGGEGRYAVVSAEGKGVGGVMTLPEGMRQPFWMGYVGMPDLDAAIARFMSAGGTVQRGPWDIPEVGRLALVTDPQGAGLALIQGASNHSSEAFDQRAPGHGNWHELHTTDPAAALEFYTGQFGWTGGKALDMGAMGTYRLFTADDVEIGGMMRAAAVMPPIWLYYFGVRSIKAAIAHVWEDGGTILHGPSEVPGGAQIVQAKDPQGALFALVGPAG